MNSDLIDYTHLMMEHTPVGMALYDIPDFRLLSANNTFHKQVDIYLPGIFTGLLSKPLMSWLPVSWIEKIVTIFENVAASGVPFHDTQFEIQMPDTRITYWDWSLHPLADDTGNILYLLQTISDKTSIVNVHRETQESHQGSLRDSTLYRERNLLRSILDQFSEGILIAEIASGITSYANEAAARFLGMSLPNLLHTPFHQHRWPRDIHNGTSEEGLQAVSTRVPWLFSVVHALCGETIKEQETLLARPDGSTFVALTSSMPLRTEQGAIIGAVVIFQDIDAQRSLNQYRHEFLSTASHELRTPVTAIQGLAELLQLSISHGRSLNSTYIQRIVNRLSEQSHHMTHLVGELLDISLLEQGQFRLDHAHSDLLPLVINSIEHITETPSRHVVHLSLEGPIAIDTLIGNFDKERIMQMVRHLISNAIKYSFRNSSIEVTLRYTHNTPDEVVLSVQNQGPSIPPNELIHIFEQMRRRRLIASKQQCKPRCRRTM